MLKLEILNRQIVFICDCGNADQKKITLFYKYVFKTDKKGYKKAVRVHARMCSVCNASITMSDALELLNKKSRQEEEPRVKSS